MYQVQRRGISGCVVFDDWTATGPAHDSLHAALAEARRDIEGGTAHAIRILGEDGTVTSVQKQQPTVLYTDGPGEPWLPPEPDHE
jgi:hypothetical protein